MIGLFLFTSSFFKYISYFLFYLSINYYVFLLKKYIPFVILKLHIPILKIYFQTYMIHSSIVLEIYFRNTHIFLTKYHLRIKMVDKKLKKIINVFKFMFINFIFILSLMFFKSYLKYYFYLFLFLFPITSIDKY